MRLSRHVKRRVTYDPRTGRIVIMLPDSSNGTTTTGNTKPFT